MRIRPACDSDLPKIAELLSLVGNVPLTEEDVRRHDADFPAQGSKTVLVLESEGEVRSVGRATRWPHEPAGHWSIKIATQPEFRRRGFGTAMLQALTPSDAVELRAGVLDTSNEGQAFAKRHGFTLHDHVFESTLNLASVDSEALPSHASRTGLRFFSLADLGCPEWAMRRMWELNVEVGKDQPGSSDDWPSFDEWGPIALASSWFDPEGQILAADGDAWVGLGAVGPGGPGRYYHLFTGVRRSHRGRGIATALKAEGIRYALRKGGTTLRTNNHSENAAMLAVNRKFGFQPEPGWLTFKRNEEGILA